MVLGLGPFIGDFEQEVLSFLPYSRWIKESLDVEKTYLSSHFNRKFLYDDWVDDEFFIPVNESLSRDDEGQTGSIHLEITQQDYINLVKKFKSDISKKENVRKNDVVIENLSYTKSFVPYSVYQKVFSPIPVKKNPNNLIVFIPSKDAPKKQISDLIKSLDPLLHLLIIGDSKCYFPEKNEILKDFMFPVNGYKKIMEIITGAKMVITPCGFWTYVCNLQGTPVFSWGEQTSLYKKDGIFNFNNKNMVLNTDKKSEAINKIVSQLEYFILRENI
jgi:hypothetical protein